MNNAHPHPVLLLGHRLPITDRLKPNGKLPSSQSLILSIGLKLRNETELDQFLRDLYTPASEQFQKYLTAEEFAYRFGPTESDYRTVLAFVKRSGFEVIATHPNRTLVSVRAAVHQLEQALNVQMITFPHPIEKRSFYAPATEPHFDEALPILRVNGLDDFYQRKMPHDVKKLGSVGPAAGSAPGGGFISKDFRNAYAPGVTLTGTGQAVGIYNPEHGFTPSDITAYQNAAGISPAVPATLIDIDGASPPPDSFSVEVTLDIQMAIAMAPGLSQVIIYQSNDYVTALNRMATDNVAKQLSTSWPTPPENASADQIYKQFMAQGQTIFCASGDAGSYYPTQPFSVDDPLITAVSATQLTIDPNGKWLSEVVWHDDFGSGGGGTMGRYPLPDWQKDIDMSANQGSTQFRNSPDVALIGTQIFMILNGGDTGVRGTSCASPLWAGYMALINEAAAQSHRPSVGALNPSLYALGKSSSNGVYFHDITVGNNLTPWNTQPNNAKEYFAVPGYDCCTGWGTPTGIDLINAIGRDGPLLESVTSEAIAMARNPDGRLELFSLGEDQSAYRIWQTKPNGNWSPWASLAGLALRQITVAQNADGRLELFALGGDRAAYHIWQTVPDGGWGGWASLGGTQLQELAVGKNADGRLELFALGGDGALYHIWQTTPNGGWSPWSSLAGTVLRSITLLNNADGRLEVFALGGDRAAYHIWQTAPNGNWSHWATLGGKQLQELAVGKNADGRLELFALGGDGALYHIWQTTPNGGWSHWVTLAGTTLGPIVVSNNADGRLEVFALGGDRLAYHIWQTAPNGGWSNWATLGGTKLRELAVGNNADGRLELFALGGDGFVYHIWQIAPNDGWGNWQFLH